MPSVEEIKLSVAASAEQTRRAVTGIDVAYGQLDEALAQLRLTAVGTSQPSLMDAVSRLEQARMLLEEAMTLARGAAEAADRYRGIA